jgi:hypothetical protein
LGVHSGLGLVATTRAEVVQKLEGVDPKMRSILGCNAPRRALRAQMIEAAVFERLESNVQPFIRQFGGVAGQPQAVAESTATVDQALFLINSFLWFSRPDQASEFFKLGLPSTARDLDLDPDGLRLATAHPDGILRITAMMSKEAPPGDPA